MKSEERLYGCGCKGGKKNIAETTTQTTQAATTETVPTVQPTSN